MNSTCISTFSACLNRSFLLPLCTLRCPAGVVFWGFFSQPWVGGHLRGVVQLLCSAVFVSLCENNLFGQEEIRVGPQLERTFFYTVRSKDGDGQQEAGREGYGQSKCQVCASFLHPCRVSLQLQGTCMSDTVISTTDRMKQARLFQCKPLWKRRRSS